jgi:hypothetical protein
MTSIVYNPLSKQKGLVPYYYRWRECDTNITSNTPANQYQRQKIIQHTVRVDSSLYTSTLGSLTAYTQPSKEVGYGVCWNQMSDRPVPSVQKGVIPTGSNSSLNRRHTSVTSSRPGCQAPGGIGCDIKHNSYDRYLNRLKGKGPLRRGIIPPTFGTPVPFNAAFPVYGGKTVKTNIVTGCNCPIEKDTYTHVEEDKNLFDNPIWQPQPESTNAISSFTVGDCVNAIQYGNNCYSDAKIIEIHDSVIMIQFDNGTIQTTINANELIQYPCDCNKNIQKNG